MTCSFGRSRLAALFAVALAGGLVLLGIATPAGAQSAPEVSVPITVSTDAGDTQDVTLGLDPDATEGIDPALGEEEQPPPPPSDIFDARLIGADINVSGLGEGVLIDVREGTSTFSGTKTHEIQLQPGDEATSIEIAWELPGDVEGRLEDVVTGGEEVSARMNGSGSFRLSNLNIRTLTVTLDYPLSLTTTGEEYTLDEDQPLQVTDPDAGVLGNDSGAGTLTASLESGPSDGTLTLNADGTFTYTPNANFNGTDHFTYEATDGNGETDSATTTLTVRAVSDAPEASDDSYATDEDQTLTVSSPGVLGNDDDADGDNLNASVVAGPSDGTLTFDMDGSFTYAPDADFNGTDSFTYEAADGTGETDSATATLTVRAVSDAPEASDDSYTTDEDQTLTVSSPGVLNNDDDADGDNLNASVVAGPSDGTLTLDADGSFTYAPDAEFNGTDSFTYEAADGTGETDQATVTVTIEAVNDAPIVKTALADRTLTANGGPLELTNLGAVFRDPEGKELSYTAASSDTAVLAASGDDGGVELRPKSPGTASVTLTASDGQKATSAEPFEVTVVEAGEDEETPTEQASALVDTSDGEDVTVDLGSTGATATFRGVQTGGSVLFRFFGGANGKKRSGTGAGASSPFTQSTADDEFQNVSRYRWEAESRRVTFQSIDVHFRLDDEDVSGVEEPSRVSVIVDSTGDGDFQQTATTFDEGGTPDDPGDDALVAEGLTTLGTFRFASNAQSNPLPVELTTFTAALDGRGAVLRWRTASETNNAGFEIQRKREGPPAVTTPQWTNVGHVDGAGTSTEPQTYRFADTPLPYRADSLVYRLRQVDVDGTAHLSRTVTVDRGRPERVRLRGPFPSPARHQVTLRYEVPSKAHVTLRVYDVLGRRVATLAAGPVDAGRHVHQADVSGMAAGTYFVRLTAEGRSQTRRLVVGP